MAKQQPQPKPFEGMTDAVRHRLDRAEQEGITVGSHVGKYDTWIRRVTDGPSRAQYKTKNRPFTRRFFVKKR